MVTLIHRQEAISLFGIPLARYIDIDVAESVLRAFRETPARKTIEIILHTPGGLGPAASQIARALSDHDSRVVAVVSHYAMSGGTLIASSADEIQLDKHAALGTLDRQLGQYAARSLVAVASMPGRHDDQTLIPPMCGVRRCARSSSRSRSCSKSAWTRCDRGARGAAFDRRLDA